MPKAKPPARKKAAPKQVEPARHSASATLLGVIEARGMTAYEVGQLAGINATIVSRFLNGERDLRLATFDKIQLALGLRLVEPARARARARPKR